MPRSKRSMSFRLLHLFYLTLVVAMFWGGWELRGRLDAANQNIRSSANRFSPHIARCLRAAFGDLELSTFKKTVPLDWGGPSSEDRPLTVYVGPRGSIADRSAVEEEVKLAVSEIYPLFALSKVRVVLEE